MSVRRRRPSARRGPTFSPATVDTEWAVVSSGVILSATHGPDSVVYRGLSPLALGE